MQKTDFLDLPNVRLFLDFLESTIDEHNFSFSHSYEKLSKGKSTRTKPWSCNSIYDAFVRYEWAFSYTHLFLNKKVKGSSFEDSKKALAEMESELLSAISANDNEACYKWCCMILDWGGVLGSESRGNKKKLIQMKAFLAEYLKATIGLFDSPQLETSRTYSVIVDGRIHEVVMNAGFTKIYSLICENFLIYDGRVGAALGLLVRQFLEKSEYAFLPDELSFRFGKARTASVNRDPSNNNYRFYALSSDYHIHTTQNIRANWIVQALFERKVRYFDELAHGVRAFESALFMIGYRV